MKKKKPALKVLGCPWCGGMPEIRTPKNVSWAQIRCGNIRCHRSCFAFRRTLSVALKAWNRRARRRVYRVEAP